MIFPRHNWRLKYSRKKGKLVLKRRRRDVNYKSVGPWRDCGLYFERSAESYLPGYRFVPEDLEWSINLTFTRLAFDLFVKNENTFVAAEILSRYGAVVVKDKIVNCAYWNSSLNEKKICVRKHVDHSGGCGKYSGHKKGFGNIFLILCFLSVFERMYKLRIIFYKLFFIS